MLLFPGMIAAAAKEAGMKCPDDPDDLESWTGEDYPHFYVFCSLQLRRRMTSLTEHWDNAKIIAAIPDDKIKTMTLMDFINAGLQYST